MSVFIIAEMTFREAARKRVILAGATLTLVFLALFYTSARFVFGSSESPGRSDFAIFEATLFLTLGLFTANIIGALVAVFSASGSISTEIEQGTIQSVVVRPISRTTVLLGKWIGHAGLITIYLLTLYGSLVAIIYTQSGWAPRSLIAPGLILCGEALVVLSVALLLSTFLPTAAGTISTLLLYITALIGGMMEQIGVLINRESLYLTGVASSIMMPTDTLYRYAVTLIRPARSDLPSMLPAEALNMGPFGAASPPSPWMLFYAIAFCICLLGVAILVFRRRDL